MLVLPPAATCTKVSLAGTLVWPSSLSPHARAVLCANDVPANTKVAMIAVQIYRMNKFLFCAGDLGLHKVQ
jgi:hypothetical protein